MNTARDVFLWLTDPVQWDGSNAILVRVGEHLTYTGVALLLALMIALPAGVYVGHTGKGATFALNLANVGRAVPAFGVIILFVVLIGIGFWPVIIALTVFAIPPILTNTFTGVSGVDRRLRDAAEGMGMRPLTLVWQVEIPVASPLIMAGVRTAAVQVVATATLAAFPGLGGLGRYIINGLAVQNYPQVIAGAVLVAVLALTVEGLFAWLERVAVPRGVRLAQAQSR